MFLTYKKQRKTDEKRNAGNKQKRHEIFRAEKDRKFRPRKESRAYHGTKEYGYSFYNFRKSFHDINLLRKRPDYSPIKRAERDADVLPRKSFYKWNQKKNPAFCYIPRRAPLLRNAILRNRNILFCRFR